MKNLANITNLDELLQASQSESLPMFINLCGADGFHDQLMDQVVSNVQKKHVGQLGYQRVCGPTSSSIRAELMITKRPVVLLLQEGEIRAIFGGISSSFELEEALGNLEI